MSKLTDNGYLIFPKIVPEDLCQAVVADILSHVEGQEPTPMGMVEMYHYQSMWNIRQYPPVHEAFASLFGTEKLWVVIDRCNYKPKWEPKHDSQNHITNFTENMGSGFIHWDININARPRPFAVQGLVALTDTNRTMGGFQCVPDLYRELNDWIQSLPTRKAVYSSFYVLGPYIYENFPKGWVPDDRPLRKWKIETPSMEAGDLLIWDSFLPHGNSPNLSEYPRFAQYVTMALPGDERSRRERLYCWMTNSPPSDWAFPGDPRLIEQLKDSARLTELGRKLLIDEGVESW